jgi:uncharacterized protein (TIGR00255 family)
MTGYASKLIQINHTIINLEIKAVNHRFLDVNIKAADEFKPLEIQIRNLISSKIGRGKIDIRLFFKENHATDNQLTINQDLLQHYLGLIKQLEQLTAKTQAVNPLELLALPGIINQTLLTTEELQPNVLTEFTSLLDEFNQTQLSEGQKIFQMLKQRLLQINSLVNILKPILAQVTQEYQHKLTTRLSEFIREQEINDNRLQQEFAFFCQKMDVSEELDRLSAHLEEFNRLLDQGGQIGKRLDFICQEMHREANTFGSKSIALETSQKSVELKVLIEQIREQVQNVA